MKIAFVWQGISQEKIFKQWNDGLREAMRIIEKEHEVEYCEPWDDIQADVILYWEAPCTVNGENAPYYNKMRGNAAKKALLFAGGPLEKEWVVGFDLLFIESRVNAAECDELNIPYKMAFGINDKIFKPEKQPKIFDGIHHGTCASWKRQGLVAEALGGKAIVCGRNQESDPQPFIDCREKGALVLGELRQEQVNSLINASHCLIQTSDFWGGGQRATLEAMAAGIPVVCMEDSIKNREFVEESGAGLVVKPAPEAIRKAVEEIKSWEASDKERGVGYVRENWTAKNYSKNILEGLCQLV